MNALEPQPSRRLTLFSVGTSHVGRRPRNEDHYARRDDLGLYVVADGVGGLSHGDVASRAAVGAVVEHVEATVRGDALPASQTPLPGGLVLRAAMRRAQQAVLAARSPGRGDLATTLAAVHVVGHDVHVAHVGDSRVYRLRGLDFEALTHDHATPFDTASVGARGVRRALGTADAHPDLTVVPAAPGDVFLLTTDGLTDALRVNELAHVLHSEALEDAPYVLVRAALERGARDNLTAVTVAVVG